MKVIIMFESLGKLVEQYKYCLKYTILITLDNIDGLVEKYSITEETAVILFSGPVINLLIGVDELFNKG